MIREDIQAELDSFISSGKATVEENNGDFITTHIEPLKIAEYFYKQAEKDIVEEIDDRMSELWEKIPDGKDVLDGTITIEQAFELGKYRALESLGNLLTGSE